MKKFEVGEKVVVYSNLPGGTPRRSIGEIQSINSEGILRIDLDKGFYASFFPQQVRRLVKKERTKGYVSRQDVQGFANIPREIGLASYKVFMFNKRQHVDDIEFVEARRKR